MDFKARPSPFRSSYTPLAGPLALRPTPWQTAPVTMGYFRSLGVHSPAALPYLIAEGVLPKDPSRDLYKWEIYTDSDPDAGEDEVVATDSCVAWARGGIVQKIFRFDVEKQTVIQALLTWFPADETTQNASKDSEAEASKHPTAPEVTSTPKKSKKAPSAATTPSKRRLVSDDQPPATPDPSGRPLSRALVVILKHQAHIFFLAGSSHVINLPFEVEQAFPAPRGLVLQRRIQPTENEKSSPVVPRAPQNSFFSSQISTQGFGGQSFNQPPSSFPRQSFSSAHGGRSRLPSGMASFSLDDLIATSKKVNNHSIPRLFSLTDPMSEVGLVVTEAQEFGDSRMENIDKSEQVLYVSPRNELYHEASPKDAPLIIVVTANYETRMYSVWHACYLDTKPASSSTNRRSSIGVKKRRSSYGATTGANTPALRPREGARESLNIAKRGKTAPGSFTNSGIHSRDPAAGAGQTAEENLASQLDPDFGLSRQPKESRRVSSLLARTELSSHHDRSAFQDLASTHDSQGTHGRRGASFGGPDRTSFGTGYARHRMSSQNFQSRLSLDVASVDTSVADLTIDGDTPTSETFDAMDLDPSGGLSQDTLDGLKKEFVLTRFSQVSMDEPSQAPIFKSFASEKEERGEIKVFTIKKPQLTAHGTHGSQCYLLLSDQLHKHMFSLGFDLKRDRALPRTSSISKQPMGNFKYNWTPQNPQWTRNKDYIDIVKIEDQGISRLVGLQFEKNSLTGAHQLRIFAPWSDQFEVIYGHPRFKLNNALEIPNGLAESKDKDAGRRRTLETPEVLKALGFPGVDGRFDIIDGENRYHRFQIPLAPKSDAVRKALEVCQFILPELHAEFLMVAWWKMTIQLKIPKTGIVDEWQAFVSALFCLIVPFVDGFKPNIGAEILRPLKQDEKAMRNQGPLTSLGRAASRFDESSAWNKMWQIEASRPGPKFWNNPALNLTGKLLCLVKHSFIFHC
jgi:anaphase-promoting complex subunit 1